MLYITTENIELKGYYSEPIWDDAPGYGDYTIDICLDVPKYTFIEAADDGKVLNVHIEKSFGVSMHEGTLEITENVKSLFNTNLKSISNEDYNKLDELKEEIAYTSDMLNNAKVHYMNLEDYLEELNKDIKEKDSLSQQEFDEYFNGYSKGSINGIGLFYKINEFNAKLKSMYNDLFYFCKAL